MSQMIIPTECLELSKIIRRYNDKISAAQSDTERERLQAERKPYADRQLMLLSRRLSTKAEREAKYAAIAERRRREREHYDNQ